MNIKTKIIPFSVLVIGFTLGASAFSSLAAFQVAPTNPPDCDVTIYPGCNPLLNTRTGVQTKKGVLTLRAGKILTDGTYGYEKYGLEVLNGIRLIDRSNIALAKDMVLTSNSLGVGTWKALPKTGGYDAVSSEASIRSTNGERSIAIASSTPQWRSCMVTKSTFGGSGAFNNYCDIANTNGEWVLTAYANANGNESADCSAVCIGYSVYLYQPTCTAPRAEYSLGERVIWTTIVPAPGIYKYSYKGSRRSSDNFIVKQYNSLGHEDNDVRVFKVDEITLAEEYVGSAKCRNSETNTLGIDITLF